MGVLLIRKKASNQEIEAMLKALETYIKVAVDIKREILAGGGVMHADCEAALIENGSEQKDIWGANWDPETKAIRYEALINIRPRDHNTQMEIKDFGIRSEVKRIMDQLLGSPSWI
jgi:hypothetical protein